MFPVAQFDCSKMRLSMVALVVTSSRLALRMVSTTDGASGGEMKSEETKIEMPNSSSTDECIVASLPRRAEIKLAKEEVMG